MMRRDNVLVIPCLVVSLVAFLLFYDAIAAESSGGGAGGSGGLLLGSGGDGGNGVNGVNGVDATSVDMVTVTGITKAVIDEDVSGRRKTEVQGGNGSSIPKK